jgi:predicted acyl esterase
MNHKGMKNSMVGAQRAAPLRMAIIIIVLIVGMAFAAHAQEATEEVVTPQIAEIETVDGLLLKGDFYPASAENAPAVLLMHQFNSTRRSWSSFLPPLLEAGYAVLNVDLRGHGDSFGDRDWDAAIGDVQTWLDWLREQPGVRPDAISIMGASVGSNLALVGCANDPECITAIALSPGLDYFGITTSTAISEGLAERSALLIAAQGDSESASSVKELIALSVGEIGVQIYESGEHGTGMFPQHDERLMPLILMWLETHIPSDEE